MVTVTIAKLVIMKKLFVIMIACILSTSLFAQKMDKMDHGKMKDCVMMEHGKMVVMKNGETMDMNKDMAMKNGTMVMRDGKVKMKNGKTTMLKDGDCVYMNGKMTKMKMDHSMKMKM